MSRFSVRAFLSKSREALHQSLQSEGKHPTSFVIGNESADLDSIACALVYGYIRSSAPESRNAGTCVIPVTNVPSSELRLRPELTALLKHAELQPSDLITSDELDRALEVLPAQSTEWTLVDHNAFQGNLGKQFSSSVVGVIDHHEDEQKVPKDVKPRIIEKTGSCSSHVVNYCREIWDSISSTSTINGTHEQTDEAKNNSAASSAWDAQVAELALGAILIDTVNLEAEEKVTDHDRAAVDYLEAKIRSSPKVGPGYERHAFFMEINDAKSNLDGLTIEEILRKDYKQWTEGDLTLGISSVVQPVAYLESKARELVPALLSFAQQRKLDIFAVMTAHNDSGTFERQLLLMAMKDGQPIDAVEKFTNKNTKELELRHSDTEVDDSSATWLRLWEQRCLAASRKQVAPLLREAMR